MCKQSSVQFISFLYFIGRLLYTNQNKSKTLQFLWLQIKILRCASLGLIRSSVKWSCDFLGGINPPICYTQLNCCVGRVILSKMPYGRQMLWKMCFACIWSRSKPVNPAITTLKSLHCVHYDVPALCALCAISNYPDPQSNSLQLVLYVHFGTSFCARR